MPVLKSLSFTAIPKDTNDPVHIRRAKFITKLEEQKQLLQDPGYVRREPSASLPPEPAQPCAFPQPNRVLHS